jgi:hypothetical protein
VHPLAQSRSGAWEITAALTTYNERFDGFIVRKFNGDKVKIAGGEVMPLLTS